MDESTTRRLGAAVIAGALVVGAFLIGGAIGGWSPFRSVEGEPFENVGPTVVESVRALSELTTVEMVEYTTIEKGNDYGWLNWARGDKIFMFAVARIGAGVDLARLGEDDIEVDPEIGKVTIELPRAEILYVEVDNDATQVYDRDTGLFTKGDRQLESDARAAAQEILVKKAIEAGILDKAEENAQLTIRELLEALGYTDIVFVRTISP